MDTLILIAVVLLLFVLLFGMYGVIRAVVDRIIPPRANPEPAPNAGIDPQVAEWRRRKAQRQQLHAELLGPDTQG
ncbi:hypothetical protein [Thermomonas fusca]